MYQHDDQAPLDDGFPGQRVCLRGVDRGGALPL